jgi:archaellum component FlaC
LNPQQTSKATIIALKTKTRDFHDFNVPSMSDHGKNVLLTRRKVEREIYDHKKELRLQEDEIERLSSELKMVRNQVKRVSEHLSQKQLICARRISDLTQTIAQIPKATYTHKSSLLAAHTQSIIQLHADYRKSLDRVRVRYEIRLLSPSLSVRESQLDAELFVSSINAARSRASATLKAKSDHQEQLVQEKLGRLKLRIATDRQRTARLEAQIQRMTAELETVLQLSTLRVEELDQAIPVVDERTEEERLAVARANYLAEENQYRTNSRMQLDSLRKRLTEVLALAADLKKKVREGEVGDLLAITTAKEQFVELQAAFARFQNSSIEFLSFHVPAEQKRQQQIMADAETAKQALTTVKTERMALMKEIRRLDFMIYGRAGQYQLPKTDHPKR